MQILVPQWQLVLSILSLETNYKQNTSILWMKYNRSVEHLMFHEFFRSATESEVWFRSTLFGLHSVSNLSYWHLFCHEFIPEVIHVFGNNSLNWNAILS